MMYYEWIFAALGVIVVYMLLGYAWAWWTQRGRDNPPGGREDPS